MKGSIIVLSDEGVDSIEFKGNNSQLSNKIRETVGGWLEVVNPEGLKRPYVMLVDEEGLLKEKYVNLLGTELYNVDDVHFRLIVGTVVIVKEVMTHEGPDLKVLTNADCLEVFKILTNLIILNTPK